MNYLLQLETVAHYQQDVLLREAEQERLAKLLRSTTAADAVRKRDHSARTGTTTHRGWALSHLWRPRLLGHAG
jgi:hypothetical protein